MTRNLNKIIDINYYPVETAKKSNMRHRPIGIGCQGLADAFLLLGMPFDSPEVGDGRGVMAGVVWCCNSPGEGGGGGSGWSDLLR